MSSVVKRFVVGVVAVLTFDAAGVEQPSFADGDAADSAYSSFVLVRLLVLVIAFAAACWAYSCQLSFVQSAVASYSGCLVAASFQPYFVAAGVAASGEIIAFASSLPAVAAVAIERMPSAGSAAETWDWGAEAQDEPSRARLVLM